MDIGVELSWWQKHENEVKQALEDPNTYNFTARVLGNISEFGYEVAYSRGPVTIDLFSIQETEDYYVWTLHVNNVLFPCHVRHDGYANADWNGLAVRVPVPIEGALVSLYGKDWRKPRGWRWDVHPWQLGHCSSNPKLKFK
eukprot:TRINITY_DN13937_c0_g1_i1.p1 TRINITY_DN13937_c0_g1~~TRINITY_DN13937_c0_g1_i1.p1  ORF type:complete len:141 (-),score=31.98 TRINITY_DN13937_c0_g1_i1:183-605(-)